MFAASIRGQAPAGFDMLRRFRVFLGAFAFVSCAGQGLHCFGTLYGSFAMLRG